MDETCENCGQPMAFEGTELEGEIELWGCSTEDCPNWGVHEYSVAVLSKENE